MKLCPKCVTNTKKWLLVFAISLFIIQQIWVSYFVEYRNTTVEVSQEKADVQKPTKIKSLYMKEANVKRPSFTFLIRPWKTKAMVKGGNLCKNKTEIHWSMVFVVKSSINNIDRRDVIRKTWGKVRVFGNARFATVFVLGNSTDKNLMRNIMNENKRHGDIIQFNLIDKPEYVPEKVLAGMQWASNLPSGWFYASVDDDIIIDYARLHQYYEHLVNQSKTSNATSPFSRIPIVCVYSYQNNDPPARDKNSKWYMPEENFPGKVWPIYCRGGMYTTSSDMVKKLYEVSRRTPRLYLDDVWITGFMRLKVEDTNENIVAAPGSRLSDAILQSGKWDESSIVYHVWGNMIEKPTDVAAELTKAWVSVLESFKSQIVC